MGENGNGEFEVVRIRFIEKGSLGIVGYAQVKFGPITVKDWKIIENDQGIYFCALPRSDYHRPMVHLEPDLRSRVYDKILEKFRLESLKFQGGGVVDE